MKPDGYTYAFLIPDTEAFVSGGNLYNRHLIDALRERGHTIYEREDIEALPGGVPLLADTLLAPSLPSVEAARAGLIVHHLESLHPPAGWRGADWFQEKEWPWLKHYAWYLATSPYTADYLRRMGVEGSVEVIEPALERLPELHDKPSHPIQALIVANLVERKGILPLLQAWAKAPPEGVVLRLAGGCGMESDYAAQCLSVLNQLEGVQYLGTLAQDALFAEYAQSNLLISAAYMETYGMALQEAAAAGLPILAYAGGNVPNHVEVGRNGQLCQSHTEIVSWLNRWAMQPEAFKPYLEHARAFAPNRQRLWADAAAQFEAIKTQR
ncbi:MAG: glycosyltransferase family 4 protein [Phaeodactylibacter sp.]|uniref:glycosyltransferase family 4 protein n=1 Tax=Phaeodactylibacter sp. TaxID=1940289 RepID=UPI0032EFC96E